jgi:hypothetical protein
MPDVEKERAKLRLALLRAAERDPSLAVELLRLFEVSTERAHNGAITSGDPDPVVAGG